MNKSLTKQIGTMIALAIIFSFAINSVSNFYITYKEIYKSAGIEAYGCANITTGLLTNEDITTLTSNDLDGRTNIGERLSWTVQHKAIFEHQLIIDANGTILALDDKSRSLGLTLDNTYPIDQEAVQELIDHKKPTYSKVFDLNGERYFSGYAPVYKNHDPSNEIVAISVIDFNANIITERTWDVVSGGILFSFFPLLLVMIFTIVMIRKKTKPISDISKAANEIANGDLTGKDIQVKDKNEVASLANGFNQMRDNLKGIINEVQQTSQQLTLNAKDTSNSLEDMKESSEQISENTKDVAHFAQSGSENTFEAKNALFKLAELIQHAQTKANDTTKNSNDTLLVAKNGKETVSESINTMSIIENKTVETTELVQHLDDYTKEIGTITEMMSGIANQTNLLALNASIEAARAGEHGKGFAVVADEVRKLAEESNKRASEVSKITEQIANSTNKALASMQDNRVSVKDGMNIVLKAGEALDKILNSVQLTVDDIQSISALTDDENETSDELVKLIEQLASGIEETAARSEEVTALSEESASGIDSVFNRSKETTSIASQLNKIVDQFKL